MKLKVNNTRLSEDFIETKQVIKWTFSCIQNFFGFAENLGKISSCAQAKLWRRQTEKRIMESTHRLNIAHDDGLKEWVLHMYMP